MLCLPLMGFNLQGRSATMIARMAFNMLSTNVVITYIMMFTIGFSSSGAGTPVSAPAGCARMLRREVFDYLAEQ
jgi:hypothetical protein